MGQEKKTYITDAGFKSGARVELKVTKPLCCGFEAKTEGVILGRARDGVKWTVQIEGTSEPMDIRFEDLILID